MVVVAGEGDGRGRLRSPVRDSLTYGRHAAFWLAVAVSVGAWLRLVLVHSPALAGFEFRHAVHAHSHVALFGWATMALFGFVARASRLRGRWVRLHALIVTAATAAAFAGFLVQGYTPVTIAIATVHVVLWYAFVFGAWHAVAGVKQPIRSLTRGALVFVLVAGAGALVPGIVRARGHTDPWLLQLSVELFLTPFLEGWLMLGVAAVIYSRLAEPGFARAVLLLLAAGALPAALFRVSAAPPYEWLTLAGRSGTVCVGLGALLLGRDALRTWRVNPMIALTGAGALLKGSIDVVIGGAAGVELIANHQLKIGYLHLLLLGVVTPALLAGAVLPRVPRRGLVALYAIGMATQLTAVALLGAPVLAAAMAEAGLTVRGVMMAALAGGLVSVVAILAMLLAMRLPGLDTRGR